VQKAIFILGIIIFSISISLAQLGNSAWPMRGHDLQRTGRSQYIGPANPTIKWLDYSAHRFDSSPVIGTDGCISAGCVLMKIHCYYPDDGAQKWSTTTSTVPVISGPAVGIDGTIYYGSGSFFAIDPNTGKPKWTFKTNDVVNSSPTIGADGTIYVGSEDKNVYAIKPDGTKKWSFLTGGGVSSSPAMSSDGTTIYIGSNDKNLYALNAADGTKKWAFPTGGEVRSIPAVATDGTIYVGSLDQKLYAVKPDGTQKWAFTTGGEVESSPAIAADGTIYVGSKDKKLYAIKTDGIEKWSYLTGGSIINNPAIDAAGSIYVSADDANIYSINPNGVQRWVFVTVAKTYSSPAIGADGTLYVGNIAIGTSLATVTVTAPNTAVQWQSGTTQKITWTSVGFTGNVAIELFKGGGRDSVISASAVNNKTYNWTILTSQAAGTDYRVKISSVVNSTVSSQSAVDFTINSNALAAPVLTYPLNNAIDIITSPILTWNPVANATVYSVEVATDATFTNKIVNLQNVTGTSYSLTNLTNQAIYYWRVKAGNGTVWSSAATANFTTIVNQKIAAPALTSPANGATGVATTSPLAWQAVVSAVSYTLQYATNINFTNATVVASNNLSANPTLLGNTRYYWEVKATDAAGTSSNWSSAWYFTTAAQTVQLTVPTLTAPANNAVNIPVSTTFTWSTVTNASAYDIDISTNPTFTTKTSLSSAVASQAATLANSSTVYYWRVRAKQGNALGTWSAVHSFTTAAPVLTTGVDAAISNSKGNSLMMGVGVVNNTGILQTIQLSQQINRQSEFYISIQNTGNVPDVFLISSNSVIDSKWKAAIFDINNIDRTRKIFTGGWASYNVKPGETVRLMLRLVGTSKQTIDENNPPTQSVSITAKSWNDITNGKINPASDTVTAIAVLTKRSTIQ